MAFEFIVSATAQETLAGLDVEDERKARKVRNALGRLQIDPRHPSLQTHKYSGYAGANGEEVFEAYAENNTPGAYWIFWHYGPGRGVISIIAITPHP